MVSKNTERYESCVKSGAHTECLLNHDKLNESLERHVHVSKAGQPIQKVILERKARGEIKWVRTHYQSTTVFV